MASPFPSPSSDDGPKSLKKRHLGFKVVVMLVAFVVGALLVEGAVRVRQWWRYGTTDPEIFQGEEDPASGLIVPKSAMSSSRMRINELRFRGPEIAMPKPPERVRLAFLGGSTTFCAEVSNDEATWPHLVHAQLQRRFEGRTLDYVNGGVPGYAVEQSLRNLRARVAPLAPDVVVIYQATNDLARDTRRIARAAGVFDESSEDPTFMAELSVAWSLVEKNMRARRSQRQAAARTDSLEIDLEALAADFKIRYGELVRAALEVAPLVAVATFSHRLRPEQDEAQRLEAAATSLYYMPYMTPEGLIKGYAAYNDAIRQVARETGVLLIETAEAVPADEKHFNDSVHFKDAGCAIFASVVAAALEHASPFKALMTSPRAK